MADFIKNMLNQIDQIDNGHIETLTDNDGIATNWSLYHSKKNPGFFTSFNQKMPVDNGFDEDTQATPFGMQQAAIATGLLPALQLQTALASALAVPGFLLMALSGTIQGDWNGAGRLSMTALSLAIEAVYFSGAFVLNLLKEVTAFITRSIATLVDLCMGPAGNGNNSPLVNSPNNADAPAPAEIHSHHLAF